MHRPTPTSTRSVLILKPLPNIDPKDKGKKRIEEDDKFDTESEEITEAKKKFDQVVHDEEVARKVQEEWEAEEEKKRLAEEEATKAAFSNEYDFIQARIEADRILAERVQEEERDQFTVKERAKFLHDTIVALRRFLAQQRSEAIRNKPPTKNQLRNQMMTYLKHVGNKKYADLKNKSFEEIKALYEKIKRFDDSFIAVGSTEDERMIKELNEGAGDLDKKILKRKFVKEDDTAKPDADGDDEHRQCLRIIALNSTIDSEVMETKSVIARLNKVSSPDGDYLVIYRANGNFRAFNYLLEITPEDWEIVRWRLYEACRVYILELKDVTIIHMLVERRYPLFKDLLQRMLDLGLEVKEESTAALHLVKFIKQQLNEE
ncbi:hypothetical protein Tco_0879919 [Tanacetum coccineum]